MSRVLPQDEWPRLDETLLQSIWRMLDPRYAEVIVIEQNGAIVGSVALLTTVHAECLSSNGTTSVGRALWSALRDRARAGGARAVWGAAMDERMRRLLRHHAEPIPGEHFLVRI